MTACTLCAGYGNRHDPIAHNWVTDEPCMCGTDFTCMADEHPCDCGHDRDYHGNADGQTGWQARCGHPDCDCDDFEAAS
jgi:hypothetical protein